MPSRWKKPKHFSLKLIPNLERLRTVPFQNIRQLTPSIPPNLKTMKMNINISVDHQNLINGFFIKPYVDDSHPTMERNKTSMMLPFEGEWFTFWGGDTPEENYHVDYPAQKGAFDFLIMDEQGKSFRTDGRTNEDYYAFGKKLMAPCGGEVVLAVDGIKDNIPGVMNPMFALGNVVIIKTANVEYLVFAHFKKHSIQVKEGQMIKQGDLLGQCGNSGNSSEAHLHFHIQNIEDTNVATGAKCFFEKIVVNGEVKTNYSPVKNDKVKN